MLSLVYTPVDYWPCALTEKGSVYQFDSGGDFIMYGFSLNMHFHNLGGVSLFPSPLDVPMACRINVHTAYCAPCGLWAPYSGTSSSQNSPLSLTRFFFSLHKYSWNSQLMEDTKCSLVFFQKSIPSFVPDTTVPWNKFLCMCQVFIKGVFLESRRQWGLTGTSRRLRYQKRK